MRHVGDVARVKAAYVQLRQARTTIEHPRHVGDVACIKTAHVELRQAFAVRKHPRHVGNVFCVKATAEVNRFQRSFIFFMYEAVIKAEGKHLARIPRCVDVAVGGDIEHVIHEPSTDGTVAFLRNVDGVRRGVAQCGQKAYLPRACAHVVFIGKALHKAAGQYVAGGWRSNRRWRWSRRGRWHWRGRGGDADSISAAVIGVKEVLALVVVTDSLLVAPLRLTFAGEHIGLQLIQRTDGIQPPGLQVFPVFKIDAERFIGSAVL